MLDLLNFEKEENCQKTNIHCLAIGYVRFEKAGTTSSSGGFKRQQGQQLLTGPLKYRLQGPTNKFQ